MPTLTEIKLLTNNLIKYMLTLKLKAADASNRTTILIQKLFVLYMCKMAVML